VQNDINSVSFTHFIIYGTFTDVDFGDIVIGITQSLSDCRTGAERDFTFTGTAAFEDSD
jgi:hypothetical protein